MRGALLFAAVLAGCVASDRVALVSGAAVLACDMAKTAVGAGEGWRYTTENNPVLRDGSTGRVVTYGLLSEGALVIGWYLLPTGWRTALGSGVAGGEAAVLVHGYHRRWICAGGGSR